MTTSAAEAWVTRGVAGELIGTFPMVDMFGAGALAEIYWINDPEMIGLRYPDNGRLAVGKGWLAWRDKDIIEKYDQLVRAWNKAHGIKQKLKLLHKPLEKKHTLKLLNRPVKPIPQVRCLWFDPDTDRYYETHKVEDAAVHAKQCKEVTGDSTHEMEYKRRQSLKTKFKVPESKPSFRLGRIKPKLKLK